MKKQSLLNRQDGFTLIEIIAVLILLGILAAVAVPRYISLQAQAEVRAVEGVRAELISRANQYYAQYLLDNTITTNAQDLTAWSGEDIGADFTLGNDGTDLTVTMNGNTYTMSFTQGVNATDGSGSPAQFGAPS